VGISTLLEDGNNATLKVGITTHNGGNFATLRVEIVALKGWEKSNPNGGNNHPRKTEGGKKRPPHGVVISQLFDLQCSTSCAGY